MWSAHLRRRAGSRRARLVTVVTVAWLATGACGGDGITVVTVRTRPAVRAVEQVEVTLANANATLTETFEVDARTFPLTFSIETGGRDGQLEIHGSALDGDGVLIGTGDTAVEVGGRTDVELMIDPTDFTVNTSFVGDQALAFRDDAGGRQLAISPAGVFTVGWSDSCQVVGRCDVFGRRFDTRGAPVATSLAAGVAQFNFNRTNGLIGFEPSLATNADGATLAAWSDGGDLLAVVIDADGVATAVTETTVASGTAPSTPAATALPNGRFIVAWTENGTMAGQLVVKAVWLDERGQPVANPVTSTAAAYTVSTTIITDKAPPALVALGDQSASAIVWRNGSVLRARFYTPGGLPRSALDLSIGMFGVDELGEPQIAAVAPDLAVLFGRRTSGGDADAGQLILRRVTTSGQRTGVDAIVAREVDLRPMALAARPDGAIAAVWQACLGDSDGSACGVRFQLFRPTLAAVGAPTFANSTTANTQIEPSLVALPDGSFVAAWSDGSQAAPDTDGFGIRARIMYPAYDDTDGLGARCTRSSECGEANVCMAGSDSAARCYRACALDRTCAFGGSCTTMGDESGCLF